MHTKSQREIMQHWEDSTVPLVSICCTTYNHDQFIKKAIEGFLFQKTTFAFEVLIRDDFSTDETTSIIKAYQRKYPDIIFPIYEEKNTYSKGIKPMPVLYKKAKGKYIALCEGDDYWLDERKLQTQVNLMNKHPEINFSFHPAICLEGDSFRKNPSWVYGTKIKVIPFRKVMKSMGTFAPTPSYMFKRHITEQLPDWFLKIAPVGDVFMEILGSNDKGALYINKPMSIYRKNTSGSWTNKYIVGSSFYLTHWEKMLESFIELDKEITICLQQKFSNCYYHIALSHLVNNQNKEFSCHIKKSFSSYPFLSSSQLFLYTFSHFPSLLKKIYKLFSALSH